MALPINIDDLINCRTVESERIEFKEGWNPEEVIRSLGDDGDVLENFTRKSFSLLQINFLRRGMGERRKSWKIVGVRH